MDKRENGNVQRGYQPMTNLHGKQNGSERSTVYQNGYQPKTSQAGKVSSPPTGSNSEDA